MILWPSKKVPRHFDNSEGTVDNRRLHCCWSRLTKLPRRSKAVTKRHADSNKADIETSQSLGQARRAKQADCSVLLQHLQATRKRTALLIMLMHGMSMPRPTPRPRKHTIRKSFVWTNLDVVQIPGIIHKRLCVKLCKGTDLHKGCKRVDLQGNQILDQAVFERNDVSASPSPSKLS